MPRRVSAKRCGASCQTSVADSPARSAARSRANAARRAAARGGGKPSIRQGSGGSPDTVTAITAAFAPGTADTAAPSAMAARASRKPGSDTSATRPPARSRASTPGIAASSLCSWSACSFASIASAASSRRVVLVSSHSTTSARASASRARTVMSPRLPIGVETSTSRPTVAPDSCAAGSSPGGGTSVMLRFAWASVCLSLALAACVAAPYPPPVAGGPAPPPVAAPVRHVAILAPLTGPRSDLGAALVNGAQLALDVPGAPVLDVRDTFGTPEGAAGAARAAVAAGDILILGPLTAAETAAVAPIAQPAGIPVLAFTNDSAQSRPGVWTMGVTPGQQVRRLVRLLADRGKVHIAGLLPHNDFGRAMETGLSDATIEFRLPPPSLREYAPDPGSIAAALAELASHTAPPVPAAGAAATVQPPPPPAPPSAPGAPAVFAYDALLLADTGPGLAMVADALPAAGVQASTQIVGPALWGSPSSGASRLAGAWYAAGDPSLRAAYEAHYQQKYGSPAPAISDLAYDSAGIARAA